MYVYFVIFYVLGNKCNWVFFVVILINFWYDVILYIVVYYSCLWLGFKLFYFFVCILNVSIYSLWEGVVYFF